MRALLGLGLVGIFATVSAADAAGSSLLVIRVKSVETSSRIAHNQPPSSLSKGDVLVQRDNLFNITPQLGKSAGALIGTDRATITLSSRVTATVAGSTSFPGGTVRFRGTVSFTSTRPAALLIVGGTGRYVHATGTVTEPATDSDPHNARNTYRLKLP
jgi:hypothetical protein